MHCSSIITRDACLRSVRAVFTKNTRRRVIRNELISDFSEQLTNEIDQRRTRFTAAVCSQIKFNL